MEPCDFYNCESEREEYTHTTPDDAIEEYLDDQAVWAWRKKLENETVTVYGFRRRVLTAQDIGSPLYDVLERLADEGEWGGPDGIDYMGDDADRMRAAEAVFVAAIIADYVVWSCEEDPTARTEVNVAAWVREHRPDWLEVMP